MAPKFSILLISCAAHFWRQFKIVQNSGLVPKFELLYPQSHKIKRVFRFLSLRFCRHSNTLQKKKKNLFEISCTFYFVYKLQTIATSELVRRGLFLIHLHAVFFFVCVFLVKVSFFLRPYERSKVYTNIKMNLTAFQYTMGGGITVPSVFLNFFFPTTIDSFKWS